MADQTTAGFMDALGLSNIARRQPQNRTIPGGNIAATFANIGRTAGRGPATQLLAGLTGGIGGLVDGEGGRGFREFGRDFTRGLNSFNDGNQARDLGITVDQLQAKRRIQQKIAEEVKLGTGSLEEQINALTQTARIANQEGDIDTALKAAQMRAQLIKQLDQQKKAGIETEKAAIQLEELKTEEDIGFEASILGKDGTGKAVRIDAERASQLGLPEEEIGRFVFVDKNGDRQVVDGVDLVPAQKASGLGIGSINPRDDNIPKLAFMNGATSGNITKMRSHLSDMGKQATIVSDVSNLLMEMTDPAFALDLTGKTAIAANKMIRFVDNAATILSEADAGPGSGSSLGKYEWNGNAVAGPAEQHQEFVSKGKDQGFLLNTLNEIAKEDGLPQGKSVEDFMPSGLIDGLRARGASASEIARVAEQYWANVMELAYMDARLQEPSNRGLSDKDIENALRRIGAATANPASFAQRQRTLLNRVSDAVDSLGSLITVPAGAVTRRSDVVDFIYPAQVRRQVRENLDGAMERLGVLEQRSGSQTEGLESLSDEEIDRRIAEAEKNATDGS